MKKQNCVEVCADGAAAMTGKHKEVTRIKVAPELNFTHFNEALGAKVMSPSLKTVLDKLVKVIKVHKISSFNL